MKCLAALREPPTQRRDVTMHTYKLLKRKDNVKYYLGINKINSRYGIVLATMPKLNKFEIPIASIDLKTKVVTTEDGWTLPDEVMEILKTL